MSRLVILLIAGVAVWMGFRALGRHSRSVVEALREADTSLAKKAPVTLEKDPSTGVYRPTKSGD